MEDVGSRRPMPPTARITWEGGGGGGILDYSLIPIPHHFYTSVCVHNNILKQKRGEKLHFLTGKTNKRQANKQTNSLQT